MIIFQNAAVAYAAVVGPLTDLTSGEVHGRKHEITHLRLLPTAFPTLGHFTLQDFDTLFPAVSMRP